jgi:hypothetical protein
MGQFLDACYANDPDFVFISHMDYLKNVSVAPFLDLIRDIRDDLDKRFELILGYGPRIEHVVEPNDN